MAPLGQPKQLLSRQIETHSTYNWHVILCDMPGRTTSTQPVGIALTMVSKILFAPTISRNKPSKTHEERPKQWSVTRRDSFPNPSRLVTTSAQAAEEWVGFNSIHLMNECVSNARERAERDT
jgi:hypothetical protein